jgi:hypothetical protein
MAVDGCHFQPLMFGLEMPDLDWTEFHFYFISSGPQKHQFIFECRVGQQPVRAKCCERFMDVLSFLRHVQMHAQQKLSQLNQLQTLFV